MKKKLLNKILFFLSLFFFLAVFPNKTFAAITATQDPPILYQNTPSLTLALAGPKDTFIVGKNYTFAVWGPNDDFNNLDKYIFLEWHEPISSDTFQQIVSLAGVRGTPGVWRYRAWFGQGTLALKNNSSNLMFQGEYYIYGCSNVNQSGCPALSLDLGIKTFRVDSNIAAHIVNAKPSHKYGVWFDGDQAVRSFQFTASEINETINGLPAVKIEILAGGVKTNATLCLTENVPTLNKTIFGINCDFGISGINVIAGAVPTPSASIAPIQSNEAGVPTGPPLSKESSIPITPACEPITKDGKTTYICKTAIGNISTDPQGFVKTIFGVVLGLAGGIALILIMVSGYKLMASQGNPEKITSAREQLVSALVGLLFIILSFVILQIIGVDILRIPGFAK